MSTLYKIVLAAVSLGVLFSPLPALAVTRFYVTNSAADKTLPTVKGTWTDSTVALTGLLGAKAGVAATQASNTSSNTGDTMMVGRWQTQPLSANVSFTTSDSIQWAIGAIMSATTNTTFVFRVHVFVVEGDGSTVRGTLLANSNGTTTWNGTATGRAGGPTTFAAVTAKAGDRIVVEVGYNRSGTSNANRTGTINYGGTGGTDLVNGSTAVTTNPGWLEFSTTFTTQAAAAPALTTDAASSITTTGATLNGTISNYGGTFPTVRGFAWGTQSALSGGDTATTTENGTFDDGSFTNNSLTLVCNTTYFYRSYATNTTGTGYGSSIQSFTTSACSAPTVQTNAAGSVTQSSATLNGQVTATGGSNATQSGFAYGFDSTLRSVIATTTDGALGGAVSFTHNLTGLDSGRTYYFRAYATNVAGTGYGSITSFTATTDASVSRRMRLFEGFVIKLVSGTLKLYQQ